VLTKPDSDSSTLASGLAAFQRQGTIFVGLNLALLALLLCAHSLFAEYWGKPSGELVTALFATLFLNLAQLVWLRRHSRPLSTGALTQITWTSIALNLLVAVLLAVLSDTEDSPYYILMIVPVLQSAFRFPVITVAGVVTVAGCFNFLWVWLYFQRHQPLEPTEYLEAGIGSLIFAMVGVVVWLLVRDLRQKEERLAENLLDLHHAREQLLLEEKLAAVGRLSSAIAHEIRNPVSLISTSIATAQQLQGPEKHEMYEIASEEASRLVALTTDFLTYAHPRPPKLAATSIRDMAGYVNDACRASASAKDVGIQVVASDALTAEADPGQLQQALINLVLNAVEAAPPESTVTVRAYARDHQVWIDTENSGNPIPDSEQALIFEPFFTTKSKGTGLGLSIARNIARAHGGDLVLTGNEPEKICFSFSLPAPNGQSGNRSD